MTGFMEPNFVLSDAFLFSLAGGLVEAGKRAGADAVTFISEQGLAPAASEVKRWNFFATAAALTVGIHTLMKLTSEQKFTQAYESLLPSIEAWSRQGEDVLLDCYRFISGENIPGMPREQTLGMWALANSLHRELEIAEAQLARSYGAHIINAMQSYLPVHAP